MSLLRIPYCGECGFMLHEDAEGQGICNLSGKPCNCDEQCMLSHGEIPLQSTLRCLHLYQKWRRGAKMAQPHPYVIGVALDACIKELRKRNKKLAKDYLMRE